MFLFLFLTCYADYDEIEDLFAELEGSCWISSDNIVIGSQIYDMLYFSDDDTVVEYEGYQDGTSISSAKTEIKYSFSNGDLIIFIAEIPRRGAKSGDFISIFNREYIRLNN